MRITPRQASRNTGNAPLHRWVSTNRLKTTLFVLLAVVVLAVPVWLVSAAATNSWRKLRTTAPPSTSHSNVKGNLNAALVAGAIYVDDSWVGTTPGTDPDGAGPATNFGVDAFDKIQDGVNAATSGGTVYVYAGTYNEDVTINQPLSLLGIDSGTKTVSGPIGGPGSTIAIAASNVTIAGLTITRAGNNTTDW